MWEFDSISAFVGAFTVLFDCILLSFCEWYYCKQAKGVCSNCKAWSCRSKQLYYKNKKAGE